MQLVAVARTTGCHPVIHLHECSQVDDPQRWLIAIISDTGMRLSEAAVLPEL